MLKKKKKRKKPNTHRFLWLIWHDTALRAKLNLLVKLVNNNYLRIKSLFFSFQQIPALSEQCSPVAIVIADTAPYFRLVFWLLLPWDLHPSLSLSFLFYLLFLSHLTSLFMHPCDCGTSPLFDDAELHL